MTIREQLQEKDHNELIEILNQYFNGCNSCWQASILDNIADNEVVYLAIRDAIVDYILRDVSEKELVEGEWCEYSDETLIKMNIKAAEKFLEEHGFAVSRYEEDGKVAGIYFEDWTEGGVNMIHMLDGRDRDMADEDWWKQEVISIYEAFDVDEEIDIHRQAQDYRNAFTCRESVEDFDSWEQRLKKMAEACGY